MVQDWKKKFDQHEIAKRAHHRNQGNQDALVNQSGDENEERVSNTVPPQMCQESVRIEENRTDSPEFSDSDYVPPSEDGDISDEFDILDSQLNPNLNGSWMKIPAAAESEYDNIEDFVSPSDEIDKEGDKDNAPVPLQVCQQSYKLHSTNRSTKIHACVFCGEVQTKLPRHFERKHHREIEVQRFLALAKGSRERSDSIRALVNKGDFHHNSSVAKEGKGMIIPKYRTSSSSAQKLVPCTNCLGMYKRSSLWRHARKCKTSEKNKSRKQSIADGLAIMPCSKDNKALRDTILLWMREDDVKIIVENDGLVMEYGCRLVEKLGTDLRFRPYISQKLRELGRFLAAFRKIVEKPVSLSQVFHPSHFENVISAVRDVSGFDMTTNSYKTPTLALKLGMTLKHCCRILKCKAIQNTDSALKEACCDFMELQNSLWKERISSSAHGTLHRATFNKPLLLPLVEDVVTFNVFLQNQAAACFGKVECFSSFLNILMAQIIGFNRRRCGEVQYLTVNEYKASLCHGTPVNKEMESALSKFEVELAKSVHRIEVRGKRGKKVPILLTKLMKKYMDYVLQQRETLGIKSIYMFSLSKVPIRGNDCLRKLAHKSGAKNPQLLTSTNLRKQLGTLMQALNLTEDEQDIIAKFMGHDIRVHRQFYRLTEDVLQAAKVTKVLVALNNGTLTQEPGSVTVDETGTIICKHFTTLYMYGMENLQCKIFLFIAFCI